MESNHNFDVVFAGNYTKDTIITPQGTRYVDGGGMNYAANASARLGAKTGVITHLAQEDDYVIRKISESGITCFPVYTPNSTRVTLEYLTDDPDIRNLYVTSVADPIEGKELDVLQTKWVAIGPSLRGEVGFEFIKHAKSLGIKIALDVQGYVRVLHGQDLCYEPWDEMNAILPYVDILKTDAVEAEFLTGKSNIREAALFFAGLGAKEILLTHRDGLQVYANGKFYDRKFHPETLIGRSGRGDTCVGSYVASRITKEPAEAATWSAAVTSLKMEKPCPYDRSLSELTSFIAKWYNHGSAD
jgi:sugar/nucleoside kinase (ribokinase family)